MSQGPAASEDEIRRHERVPIARVDEGAVVKIVGVVVTLERTLTSPLQGIECVHYDVLTEGGHSALGLPWWPVQRVRESVDFRLQDASGEALVVLGDDAFVSAEPAILDPPPSFLGQIPREQLGQGTLRALERVLAVGARVAVVGRGSWRIGGPGAQGGAYRDGQPRLFLEGTPDLLVSDDPDMF